MSNFDFTKLTAGDVFYECSSGINIMAQAITSPVLADGQWTWQAINMATGNPINYLIDVKYKHYGPKLYSEPQYCRIRDGEIEFEYS